MKKLDAVSAGIIGLFTGIFFFFILKQIEIEIPYSWLLIIIFPPLAVLGLFLASIIGKKFLIIFQAAKFSLVGVLATIIDLGLLNVLMWISGIVAGIWYSIFKGISFVVATCSKYFGDKFWAFEKMERAGMGREFSQFFAVTLIGLGINVGVASLVVNIIGSQFGLTEKIWANIGGILAVIVGALWNFLGYKFIVFKK